MPVGEAAPQTELVGIRTGIPPAPPPLQAPGITTPSSHDGSGSRALRWGPSSKPHSHPRDHQPFTDLT